LGVVGAVGSGLAVYYAFEKERRQTQATTGTTSIGKPDLGGQWTLVEAGSGRPVTDASFRGRYTLLYFGFARCPDICPAELVKVGKVLNLLRGDVDVVPLFVSLDPRRDSLDQLRHYAKDFDPRIKFLVGTPEQVRLAAKRYRVYTSVADEDKKEDDYLIDHSIVLYLTGPDGQFLDFFTQSLSAADVAKRVVDNDKRFRTSNNNNTPNNNNKL